ncbi:MAG TPA: glycosyltransferase family 39 protein [Micromonosporaceae bacterium]|nr:glycosyltransferase family 39 protein [Micromonosporaceae bacterium]
MTRATGTSTAATADRAASAVVTPARAALAAGAVACVTAFSRMGVQPLSWDEAVSANAAHRTPTELWHLLGHTDAPLGAYYALLSLWVRLLGTVHLVASEGWLRTPSALAAVAAVALTALLGARMFDPVTGLLGGTLLAVFPPMVFYADDARPYALAVLLVVAATHLLLDAVDNPTPGRLAGYTAVAIAALYIQLLAAFVLLAHAVYGWRSGLPRRRLGLVAAAVVVAVAPLLMVAHRQTGEIGWIPAVTAAGVASFVVRVAGGAAVAACVAALCVLSARPFGRGLRRMLRRDLAGERLLLVAAWAALPVVGTVAVSLAQPVLVPRYALVAAPAITLSCALLLRRLPRPAGRAAVAGLAAAALVASAVQLARPYKYEDDRAAADAIMDASHPGDAMVFVPSVFRVGLEPYLRADGDDSNTVVPADVALLDPASLLSGDVTGGLEYPAARVAARIAGTGRVFLVGDALPAAIDTRPGSPDHAAADLLQQGYRGEWHRAFGAVTVTLFVRR